MEVDENEEPRDDNAIAGEADGQLLALTKRGKLDKGHAGQAPPKWS